MKHIMLEKLRLSNLRIKRRFVTAIAECDRREYSITLSSGFRSHQACAFAGRAVHPPADRVHGHRLGVVRSQHGLGVFRRRPWIEPSRPVPLRQYHRHTFMDLGHQCVGVRHQNGEGVDAALRPLPVIPQTRQGEWLVVPHVNEEGLLAAVGRPPFVEAITRDETAVFAECAAEHGLAVHRLRARIDRLGHLFHFLGPVGHEAPAQHVEAPRIAGSGSHNKGLLRRGEVVAWRPLRGLYEVGVNAEELGEGRGRRELCEASAHDGQNKSMRGSNPTPAPSFFRLFVVRLYNEFICSNVNPTA